MTHEWQAAQLLSERPVADLGRLRSRGLTVGALGIVATAAGFFLADRSQFLQSYLIAYMFWIGISLGSLVLLMVQYLSGGAWGLVARRVFEASARTLPLMAILFLPIAFNLEILFVWARPEAATDALIQTKVAYLNKNFFYFRAALYFVIWIGLTTILTRLSKAQDQGPAPL